MVDDVRTGCSGYLKIRSGIYGGVARIGKIRSITIIRIENIIAVSRTQFGKEHKG
jgi:hypothetical protein